MVKALNNLKFIRTPCGSLSFNPEPMDHCHPYVMNITMSIIGMRNQKKRLMLGGRFVKIDSLIMSDM